MSLIRVLMGQARRHGAPLWNRLCGGFTERWHA